MAILALISIISPTFAGFTSQEDIEIEIQADTWPVPWAQTDVVLTIDGQPHAESCGEVVTLEAVVTNIGKYESIEGDIHVSGMADDEITQLEPFESESITFSAEAPSVITVMAADSEGSEILSDSIEVTCPPPPQDACGQEGISAVDTATTENQPSSVNENGVEDSSSCQPQSPESSDVIGGEAEVNEDTAPDSPDAAGDDKKAEAPKEDGKTDDKKEETKKPEPTEQPVPPVDNPTEPTLPATNEQPSQPNPEPVGPTPEPTAVKEGE